MRVRRFGGSLVLGVGMTMAVALYGQNGYHVYPRWRQTESARFVVVFPEGFEKDAAKALEILERLHERYGRRFPYGTGRRTWVILSDHEDAVNGWATTYPFKRMSVLLQRPDTSDVFAEYRDHLELLLSHEYTHILHLDQMPGVWRLFGVSPNALLPMWMLEGLAVFHETDFSGGGRLGSDLVESWFRTESLRGMPKGLSDLTVFPVKWPGGAIPYVHGAEFYAWLARTYGTNSIYRQQALAAAGLPYLHGLLARGVYGRGFPELYRRHRQEMEERHRAETEAAGRAAAFTAYEVVLPAVPERQFLRYHDGSLWFHEVSEDRRPAIIRYDLATTRAWVAAAETDCKGLAVGGAGLFWAGERIRRNEEYHYNLRHNGRWVGEERMLRPFMLPDGRVGYIARLSHDWTVLKAYEVQTGYVETVWSPPEGLRIVEAEADGAGIWLALKREGGFQDLYRLDWATGVLRRLTRNVAVESHLSYDAKTRRLYFAANRDGLWQIFSVGAGGEGFRRHVRIPTAAVSPCVVEDRLYFFGVLPGGMALCRTPLTEGEVVVWPEETEPEPAPVPGLARVATYDPLVPFVRSVFLVPVGADWGSEVFLGGRLYASDLFDALKAEVQVGTRPWYRHRRLEYKLDAERRSGMWAVGAGISDRDAFDADGNRKSVQEVEGWARWFVRQRGWSFSAGPAYVMSRGADGPRPWTSFLRDRSDTVYLEAVFSALRASRRAVQYEQGGAVSQLFGVGVVRGSVPWGWTRLDHYLPLEWVKHGVFYGRHELGYRLDGGWWGAGHKLAVDLPLVWREGGAGQWPWYFHYLSMTLSGGGTKDLAPPDFLLESLLRSVEGWHVYGGADLNLAFTFLYRLPVKVKVGVVAGTFGVAPSLGLEAGLYYDYHTRSTSLRLRREAERDMARRWR